MKIYNTLKKLATSAILTGLAICPIAGCNEKPISNNFADYLKRCSPKCSNSMKYDNSQIFLKGHGTSYCVYNHKGKECGGLHACYDTNAIFSNQYKTEHHPAILISYKEFDKYEVYDFDYDPIEIQILNQLKSEGDETPDICLITNSQSKKIISDTGKINEWYKLICNETQRKYTDGKEKLHEQLENMIADAKELLKK